MSLKRGVSGGSRRGRGFGSRGGGGRLRWGWERDEEVEDFGKREERWEGNMHPGVIEFFFFRGSRSRVGEGSVGDRKGIASTSISTRRISFGLPFVSEAKRRDEGKQFQLSLNVFQSRPELEHTKSLDSGGR